MSNTVPSRRLMGGVHDIPTGPATTVETTPDDDVELAVLLEVLDFDELDKLELVTAGADELELLVLVELVDPEPSILNQLILKPPEMALIPKVCLPAVSVTARWIVTHVCHPPVLPTVTVS